MTEWQRAARRRRLRRTVGAGLLPLAAMALLLALAPGGASAATCASSTPANNSYTDPAADGTPDVTGVTLSLDAACNLGVTYTVADRPTGLDSSDVLLTQIDTDGNVATGQPGPTDEDFLAGADVQVAVLDDAAFVAPFTGPGQGDLGPEVAVTKVGSFGVSVPLSMLTTTTGTAVRAWAVACDDFSFQLQCDLDPAPEGDSAADVNATMDGRVEDYVLPLVFSATAAPPADTTPPKVTVSGKKEQPASKLKLKVGCDETCEAKLTAKFKVELANGKTKAVKLKSKGASIAAGATKHLVAKATNKAKKALKQAEPGTVKTTAKVTATDAAGNKATATKRLNLAV